ncbi:MAG: YIP1 family protein [Anaerolineae bacterium]|nr:YIP1 family protein [Anaerolineae bacterium]
MNKGDIEPRERKGPLKLLWGMIVRPRATLEYLSTMQKKRWWVPALLMLVILITVTAANSMAATRTAQQIMMEVPVEMSAGKESGTPPSPGMSPEEEGNIMPTPAGVAPIMLVLQSAGSVIGAILSWLVWAGALYLAIVFLGQNHASFGAMFRMVVWVWAPGMIRGLVQSVYLFAGGSPIYNQGLSGLLMDKSPKAIMTSTYIPPSMGKMVFSALLAKVDIYLFWQLGLLVLGLMIFARLPKKKALFATCGVWLLLTLLSFIPALVGGMFGQAGAMF